MAESAFLQIHAHDHVAVALRDVEPGEAFVLNERSIIAKEKIPKGHKMALCHLTVGDHVMKYGAPIGHLISDVTEGGHVHAQNGKRHRHLDRQTEHAQRQRVALRLY